MKKLLSIFSLLLLVGCTTASEVKPVNRNVSFTCEMTYYNEYYELSCEIDENGNMEIGFIQPKELSDLTFKIENGEIKSEFKGISFDFSDPHKTAFIDFIYTVFKADNPAVYEKDDEFFIKGNYDGGEFKMFLGASGLPIKIIDSSGRFQILIKNPTIK